MDVKMAAINSKITNQLLHEYRNGNITRESALRLLHTADNEQPSNRDIAIIGMAVKLPNIETLEDFWQLLIKGKAVFGEFPENRIKQISDMQQAFFGNIKKSYLYGGYLSDISSFDYDFFKISKDEARLIDPQQRILLETIIKAFEDAGYGGEKLASTSTGVVIGHSGDSLYGHYLSIHHPSVFSMSFLGNAIPMLSSRIAYTFDLTGPNMVIDTACSSSLTALNIACSELNKETCEYMIIGGVKLNILPLRDYDALKLHSEKTQYRIFEQEAEGIIWGEGCACLLLKPLDMAMRDGDAIHAVIKGSAVFHAGRSANMVSPNYLSQSHVMTTCWENAGINPRDLKFIEAHGTGTAVGDVIEIQALTHSFEKYTQDKQFCAIGTAKRNVGHLDNVSGLMGIIKAVLSLQNRCYPPSFGFNNPNRLIDYVKSPVFINNKVFSFEDVHKEPICAVSAFGIGGVNAHLVLQAVPPIKERNIRSMQQTQRTSASAHVLTISAHNEDALQHLIDSYYTYFLSLPDHTSLDNICYTANTSRGQYAYRIGFMFVNLKELNLILYDLKYKFAETIRKKYIYYCDPKNDIINIPPHSASQPLEKSILLLEHYIRAEKTDFSSLYDYSTIVRFPVYVFKQTDCWYKPDTLENENKGDDLVLPDFKQLLKQLLAAEYIDDHADLFEHGLDSLKILQLCNILQQRHAISLTMEHFLKFTTIDALSQYILSCVQL